MTSRREFIVQISLGSTALITGHALAQGPMVAENEAQAMAMGYKADGTKVDKKKFSPYVAGRQCNGCALFQGKASDVAGGCPLFAGKQVAAKGWCNAWAKKA